MRPDQPGVTLERHIRTQAEAFHHAGSEPLYDPVGRGHELQARLNRLWRLQIQSDRAATACGNVRRRAASTALAIYPHHIGPKV
jgi:hypothetical protein